MIGIGDISVHLSDGSDVIMNYVCHVLQLTHSLMFVGELNERGYKVIFDESQSHRITKGNIIIGKGNKFGSLYPLFVHKKEHLLVVIDQPMMDIWHGSLGHMSPNGMAILSLKPLT